MMIDLFDLLRAFQGRSAFNQYLDQNPALDQSNAAVLRRANLRRYLDIFGAATYVLVGEAAGYAGCRFSGIPFTDEAQLMGAEPLPWAAVGGLAQTSLGEPWSEQSARMVWAALDGRRDCVLWNAFPWHPHGDNPLSNRRPRADELRQAADVLRCFLSLFPQAEVHAIGRVSERALQALGIQASYIRHPAHGGKRTFFQGVAELPRRDLD